ncbi:MAG: hemolysin family protein [Acidobacteriota bacterium]
MVVLISPERLGYAGHPLLAFLIIAGLVAVNAVYVLAEYSIVGVGPARARRLSRQGRRGARLLEPMVVDAECRDRAITACQVGISASSLVLGAYAQQALSPALVPLLARWGDWGDLAARSVGAAVILGAVSSFQIVFGEQLPKSLAVRDSGRWARITAPILSVCSRLFSGFITVLNGTAGLILKGLRLPARPRRTLPSSTEIGWLVLQSARTGVLDEELGSRLHNVLRLATRTVRDVMVPRVTVVAVPETLPWEELVRRLRETDHARLPVHRGSLDEITGLVHAKDVFLRSRQRPAPAGWADLIRPVVVVPWSLGAGRLLGRMRAAQTTLAVVLDEHGGTAGIATLADVMDEVLGESEEDNDLEGRRLGQLPGGRIRVRAEESVEEVNTRFHLGLREGEAHTIGGLIMEVLERVARPGDEVQVAGWRLKVEGVHGHRIRTVLLKPAGGNGRGGRC